MKKKELNINGTRWTLLVDPLASLAYVLQNQLKLNLNDFNCGEGDCEECFVIINGEVVLPCAVVMRELTNGAIISTKDILTKNSSLQAVQLSWVLHGSPGCFRCAGKVIGTSAAMLEINPFPTQNEVKSWFCNKHITCCTSERIVQKRFNAIVDAARVVRGEISISELAHMVSAEKKVIDVMQKMQHKVIIEPVSREAVPELGIRIPPGTLHLALVRAGVFNAKLRAINVDGAWSVPGVCRVITSYDVLGSNILSLPNNPSLKEQLFQPVICREEIKSKYDVIAVVCADTQQNALLAAQNIKATYKFLDKAEPPVNEDSDMPEPACHPEAYNVGFAHLDRSGRLAIYSKHFLPDQYRCIIAKAIGLNEELLELVPGNAQKSVPQNYYPVLEAILGLAFLSTGKPVFLKCSNYTSKNSGSVNVQWSSTNDAGI